MENDRPRLEEGEIAFFIGRNLPERMKPAVRGFLHLTERKKTNLVRLAYFFKRPANPHVTRLSSATIGRAFKGGNGGGHCYSALLPVCVKEVEDLLDHFGLCPGVSVCATDHR